MSRSLWLRRLSRVLGPLLMVAAAIWIVRALILHGEALEAYEWEVNPVGLAFAILAHVAAFSWGVWVWGRVLRHLAPEAVPFRVLNRIWFVSSLARYLPGKVFQFVAMARMSPATGVSAPVLLTSALVQMGFTLLAALILGAATLGFGQLELITAWALLGLTLLLAGVGAHPRVINALLGVIPRLLGREVLRWEGGWRQGWGILAGALGAWSLSGVAFFLLVQAVGPVELGALPGLAGANALAFVVGYVSLLPGGLGLREVALAELLTPFLPSGVTAVIAIAARLSTLLSELVGAGLALLLYRGGSSAS